MPDTLETVSQDLDEARAKIEATRAALQAALDAQETSDGELAALVARLERMAAEVERIEGFVSEKLALTRLNANSSQTLAVPMVSHHAN
jgi:septal ring factor EnvC (AmiA/AmiB activator)